jgi:uncharacterized delta-60 repeat protein
MGVANGASAAPGDLDRFFGQEGIVRLEQHSSAFAIPVDLAIGPKDSIYVLRREVDCFGACTTLLVTRYDSHGALDRSFGTGGVAVVGPFQRPMTFQEGSLAVDSDGRVVVASADDGDLVLGRLNAGGSPDASFGAGGTEKISMGVRIMRPRLAIASDGRIVAGAESEHGYGEGVVVAMRFTAHGSTDPTFNSGVSLVTPLGSGLGGLGIFGDGRIALASPSCCYASSGAIHVGLLNLAGAFDARFGNQGHRFLDDIARRPTVDDVLTLPGGKIDVVGGGDKGAFFLRLLSSGRLDPTFGHAGTAYVNRHRLTVVGMTPVGKGRLAIAGDDGRYQTQLIVMRRQANGRPDRTFGGGGPVQLSLSASTRATAIGVQSGGRIVVLGEVGNCERSCAPVTSALLRFLGGSSRARCAGKKATIVGTRNGEHLVGTAHRDVIAALSGDDVVVGGGGDDLICGGGGNDRLSGGGGKDRLLGGSGRDRVTQ